MQVDWCKNLSPGRLATMACLLEVSAPKPGNVHRGADFEDTTFVDFLASAVAFGNSIDAHSGQPLGKTVLAAIRQTALMAGSNTNLGLVLLITPLAKCPGTPLEPAAVQRQLQRLTGEDGRDVYEAIRLARPGGLGHSPACDVDDESVGDVDLLRAMEISADQIGRAHV